MRPVVRSIRDGDRIYICPLHDAAATGDMRQLRAMLSAGANANAATGGETPLHYAAREGHVQAARALLGAGASADARDADGCTPLHWAARAGQAGAAGALLGAGASANARCGGLTETALILATQEGHIDVMRTLLGAGADADARDSGGSAALHHAASSRLYEGKAIEATKVLLGAGADANARNAGGWTPYAWAERHGSHAVRKLLQAAGGGAAAARSGHGRRSASGCSDGELKCKNGYIFACREQYDGSWDWQTTFDTCTDADFGGTGQ